MDYEQRFCPHCDSYRGYVCAEHRKPSYKTLETKIAQLQAEIARLAADNDGVVHLAVSYEGGFTAIKDAYSTPEAAEKAKEER